MTGPDTDHPEHQETVSFSVEETVREEFDKKAYSNVVSLLKTGAVPQGFANSLFAMSLTANAESVARCLIDEKLVAPTGAGLLEASKEAAGRKFAGLCIYLALEAEKRGEDRTKAWVPLLSNTPAKDHDMTASRLFNDLLAAKVPRQEALDETFFAAVQGKAFGAFTNLLDKGASPNAGGGLALLHLVVDPPSDLYKNHAEYEAILKKMFDKGYDDQGMLDMLGTIAAQRFVDGEQRKETLYLLFDKGADPWHCAREAQNLIDDYYITRGDDASVHRWASYFDEKRTAEAAQAQKEFVTLFGHDFRADDLVRQEGDADTGLMIAARARMLPQVLSRMKGGLSPEDLVRENGRHQSLLGLAADRGDAQQLFAADLWKGREKEALETAKAYLNNTPERLPSGGFEALEAAVTRETINKSRDHARWKL